MKSLTKSYWNCIQYNINMKIVLAAIMMLLLLGQITEGRRRTRMVAGRRGSTGISKGIVSMIKSFTEDEADQE